MFRNFQALLNKFGKNFGKISYNKTTTDSCRTLGTRLRKSSGSRNLNSFGTG